MRGKQKDGMLKWLKTKGPIPLCVHCGRPVRINLRDNGGTYALKTCSDACRHALVVMQNGNRVVSETTKAKQSSALKTYLRNHPKELEHRRLHMQKLGLQWKGKTVTVSLEQREVRAKQAKDGEYHKRFLTADALEKRRIALEEHGYPSMKGREQIAVKTKMGITNHSSKVHILVSPAGTVYEIVNLSEFVRTHEFLFDKKDVQWKDASHRGYEVSKGALRCNALAGLSQLSRGVTKSCKGWTALSRCK